MANYEVRKTLDHGCHGMGVGWLNFETLAGLLLVEFRVLSCCVQYATVVTFRAVCFNTYHRMVPKGIMSIDTWEVLRKIASALSTSSVYGRHEVIPLICFSGTWCFTAGAPKQRWASLLWRSSYSPSWRWSWTLRESAAIRHHESSILLMVHTYHYISYHIVIFATYWKSDRKGVWPSL